MQLFFLLSSFSFNLLFFFLIVILYQKNNRKNLEIAENSTKIFSLEEKILLVQSSFENEKKNFASQIGSLGIEKQNLFEKNEDLKEKINLLNIEKTKLQGEIDSKREISNLLNNEIKNLNIDLETLRQKFEKINSENSGLKAEKISLTENLQTINQTLLPQFKNIAFSLLQENSEKFNSFSQEKLNEIVRPLNEKIKDFQGRIQEIFNEDQKEKSSLKEAINSVVNSNEYVRKEAFKLSNALKGNRLMLGHWGEIALENILNSSGLRKDQDYFLQFNGENQNEQIESKLKPDALIKLPDDKYVIIDSKISFFNYSGYEDATSNDEKLSFVKQFVGGLKTHIESLSSKEYHLNLGIDTPEITLMFIPVESWYNVAIKHFPEIYNFAWGKNIAIVSPSTLFVVLKTMAYIWKGKLQAKNSLEIASMGGKIYDSIAEFSEVLMDVGKSIEKAAGTFEKAMMKLKHGRGNLISRAEKLRNLGVKNNKLISSDLIERNLMKGEAVLIEKSEVDDG
jgi:DNA recombination protein RmuC